MIDMMKDIDTMPALDRSVGLNYSNTMSPEEKINYLVQNLRLVLSNQKRLDIMTGDSNLDYKQFPFTKKSYDIQQDDFRGEGKAIVDLLRRLNWEKKGIIFEKYDISSLSELIPEQQSQLRANLQQNTHSISIVIIDDKKYIVDCAYRQFFSNINIPSSDTMNLGKFMLKDDKSRKIAEQMLKCGFIEVTPENLKTYMDGFIIEATKDEHIKLPTEQEYANKVKGQTLSIGDRVQNEYYLRELWKLYLERHFPDNSDETLKFKKENNRIFCYIKSNLCYSTDSFQIVTVDDKKYIRTKNEDIEFSLEHLKTYLDGILIEAAQDKSGKCPNIVTPSIEEYLRLYPCAELPKEYSNYIIDSEPFIIGDENQFEEFSEEMSDEEKITSIVQKERKYLMKNFDLTQESLSGECEDSSVRVILDCTSKGFEDAMFLSAKRYLGGEGHNCTIASLNGKSYLIDCTYRQFFTKSQVFSIGGEEHHHCGIYMIADEGRKKVAEQILRYGWIEATPENLKAYMDGFEMAKMRSFAETGISLEEYLKMLAEDETVPIHIVTPRQMVEAGIDKNIATENIEQASALIESLEIENEQVKSH